MPSCVHTCVHVELKKSFTTFTHVRALEASTVTDHMTVTCVQMLRKCTWKRVRRRPTSCCWARSTRAGAWRATCCSTPYVRRVSCSWPTCSTRSGASKHSPVQVRLPYASTRAWCKLVLGSGVKLCVARHSTKFVLSHSFKTPTLFRSTNFFVNVNILGDCHCVREKTHFDFLRRRYCH